MKKTIKNSLITLVFLAMAFLFISTKPVYALEINDRYTYNLRNKNSGKYLNVNYGTDANGTNVTQFTKDGGNEQKFCFVWEMARDAYKLYTICSSDGWGRVLDVLRTGGSSSGNLVSGCNVDIWDDTDDNAQYWKVVDRGDGYYSLHLWYNQELALTSIGTGNGSGAGTSSSSTGNVIVQTYTGADNQLWCIEHTPVLLTWNLVNSSKYLRWTRNHEVSIRI